MIGVAAGKFHTVLWTREAVYTLGLNGGQLGKSQHRNISYGIVHKGCTDSHIFDVNKL